MTPQTELVLWSIGIFIGGSLVGMVIGFLLQFLANRRALKSTLERHRSMGWEDGFDKGFVFAANTGAHRQPIPGRARRDIRA